MGGDARPRSMPPRGVGEVEAAIGPGAARPWRRPTNDDAGDAGRTPDERASQVGG